MHNIEPYYNWEDIYKASDDELSPFYGKEYNELEYSQKIYNYYIHPHWDDFGANTLYLKILYADYDQQFAVIEFIGEWNDCIDNDIMYLKREIIDHLTGNGIYKFLLIGENVLNFHADEDAYYEEWWEDIKEQNGWICFANLRQHVIDEMDSIHLENYLHYKYELTSFNWRKLKPQHIADLLDKLIHHKQLSSSIS